MCIRRKLRTACAIIEEADGTTRIEQRQFGAFKRDRRALAKWAAALLPDQVVMESTGIYDQCTNPCRLVVARFDARLLEGLASQRNALALLQTLPNVDLIGAAMLLVEIGSNMDAFGSADRLASWVGICRATTSRQGSVNQVVSAKAISMSEGFFANSRMPPAAPRLSSSQSSRVLIVRRGHKCSIVALGHKMLRIIFFMLKRNQHCRDSATDYEALSVQRNAPAGSKHWRNSALSPPSPDSACIVQQAAR